MCSGLKRSFSLSLLWLARTIRHSVFFITKEGKEVREAAWRSRRQEWPHQAGPLESWPLLQCCPRTLGSPWWKNDRVSADFPGACELGYSTGSSLLPSLGHSSCKVSPTLACRRTPGLETTGRWVSSVPDSGICLHCYVSLGNSQALSGSFYLSFRDRVGHCE